MSGLQISNIPGSITFFESTIYYQFSKPLFPSNRFLKHTDFFSHNIPMSVTHCMFVRSGKTKTFSTHIISISKTPYL